MSTKKHQYGDAIDGLAESIENHRRFAIETSNAGHGAGSGFRVDPAFHSIIPKLLANVTPFFFSHEIGEALVSAARTLPIETEWSSDLLPAKDCWYWFEQPLTFEENDSDLQPFSAQALHVFNDSDTAEILHSTLGRESWLHYMAFARAERPTRDRGNRRMIEYDPSGSFMQHIGCSGVMEADGSIAALKESSGKSHEGYIGFSSHVARFLVAAGLWIRDRIVVAEDKSVERHVRKRASVAMGPNAPKTVKVVMLRRHDRVASHDQHGEVEYSCQWVVRGHWRQQFYPKTQKHQPKWILPYVKGPEDKPLKTPPPTVFAVTR